MVRSAREFRAQGEPVRSRQKRINAVEHLAIVRTRHAARLCSAEC